MATTVKGKKKKSVNKTPKFAGPGQAGSSKKLRKALEQASDGFGPKEIKSIPAEPLTVRFAEEPGDWYGYNEHWIGKQGAKDGYPIPCIEGDCAGCDGNFRRYIRYLANAWCVDDNQMKLLKLPKSLVDQLMEFQEKYGTILDRDYDLTKKGSGQQGTSYHAVPDDPKKVKTSRFVLFDHEEILQKMLDAAENKEVPSDDDEDEDDYDESSPWDDDDEDEDDEDDDDDEEDDEEPTPRRKKATKKVASKKSSKKSSKKTKKTKK